MTSQDQEMVERVARAIYEGRNGRGAIPWSRREWSHREPYLKDARAAIEAMMEPTPEQIKAMKESVSGWPRTEAVRAIYQAALRSSLTGDTK